MSLDLWPVLRFDGRCADSSYPNDYLVIVDVGGNDTYRNNAGSNMVDLNFSPAGSAVTGLRGTGPARGCQRAIPGLTAADCVPSAAVLLDLQGQDTYGVKQTPDHDAGCTTDLVIRRMMTGGAGFLGVGILRDSGGARDVYTGKTGSLGAGHIFGVGLLSDTGGNDSYAAVRNSQGFALLGGLGVLRDSGRRRHLHLRHPGSHQPRGGEPDRRRWRCPRRRRRRPLRPHPTLHRGRRQRAARNHRDPRRRRRRRHLPCRVRRRLHRPLPEPLYPRRQPTTASASYTSSRVRAPTTRRPANSSDVTGASSTILTPSSWAIRAMLLVTAPHPPIG